MSLGPKIRPTTRSTPYEPAPGMGFTLTELRGKFEEAQALHKSGQLNEAHCAYETTRPFSSRYREASKRSLRWV
jgi:hypothetical protein